MQFTTRTTLVTVTVLALALGFRRSMSTLLPEWCDLEQRLAAAPAFIVEHGQLHGKGYSFDGWQHPTSIDWLIGLVSLIAVYIARNLIVTSNLSNDLRVMAYAATLFAFIPFLYLRLTEWGNGLVYFSGNWIFMPWATLFVPTVFFVRDISRDPTPTLKWRMLRSTIELLILTPVWFVISVFLMLLLGFAWI